MGNSTWAVPGDIFTTQGAETDNLPFFVVTLKEGLVE